MPRAQMSIQEKLAIGTKSIELRNEGKFDEADKVFKQMPVPPYLAKWAKDHIGVDFLIQGGWNLSEAEMEYGQDWLHCISKN